MMAASERRAHAHARTWRGRLLTGLWRRYTGNWAGGDRSGSGTYTAVNGTTFAGDWTTNLLYFGRREVPSGVSSDGIAVYEGQFGFGGDINNIVPRGTGKCTFFDGRTYQGDIDFDSFGYLAGTVRA
jgi:hypothetical protein